MNFHQWVDLSVDTDLYLQLQDLVTVLSGDPDLTFDYKHGSYIDIVDGLVTGSQFWDTVNEDIKESGYKTDVFLRTLGTLHHSDMKALQTYQENTEASKLPKFAAQLVTLLEDLRLEEIIKKKRPGTKRDFQIRKKRSEERRVGKECGNRRTPNNIRE